MRWRGVLAAAAFLMAADLAAVPDRPVKKKPDPVKEELKKLEGTWTYAPAEARSVTIRGGVYTSISTQGNVVLSAVMKIDPTKHPKWLDMSYTAGDYAGRTLAGVYELKGDTLRLYMDAAGRGRPAALPAAGVTTLVRQKGAK